MIWSQNNNKIKSIIDSHTKKVAQHKTKENHQTTKWKTKRKEQRETQNHWKARFKMAIKLYLTIINLNANGLNAPIKIHRVADWIRK